MKRARGNIQTSEPDRSHSCLLSTATTNRTRLSLLISTALGASLLGASVSPVMAQNECGVPPPGGGTVSCPPSNNPYPNGITYAAQLFNLTVLLQSGVQVTDSITIGSSTAGVNLNLNGPTNTSISTTFLAHDGANVGSTGGAVVISLDGVSTVGDNARGIVASGRGTTDVTANTVTTQGDNATGILATENLTLPGVPSGGTGTSVKVDQVVTTGSNAIGISAAATNFGVAVTSNQVQTSGDFSTGILASGVLGQVNVNSGTVTTHGFSANGIDAQVNLTPTDGPGASIHIESGSISTDGSSSIGIRASAPLRDVTVISGSVSTAGEDAHGIVATIPGMGGTFGDGKITIQSGSVATQERNADGITAVGSGEIAITSTTVSTLGSSSVGISANTMFDRNIVINSGTVTTAGDTLPGPSGNAHGIEAIGHGGTIDITSGAVSTQGFSADGINASTENGAIDIHSTSVTTSRHRQPRHRCAHDGRQHRHLKRGRCHVRLRNPCYPRPDNQRVHYHSNNRANAYQRTPAVMAFTLRLAPQQRVISH